MMTKPHLHYYSFDASVVAFSTTRHGGVSEGCYGEFNINAYCGDTPEHIARNRQSLSALLEIPEPSIIMPHQVHGTQVYRVDAPTHDVIEGVDAVMTDVAGLCIGVSTADCIPILLYDPCHHAVCAVHAGWRGTVQRILCSAMAAMTKAYGTIPADLKAVIGPGISLESFEVGDEVYQQFADAGFDMHAIARKYKKWHLDLPLCNRMQMEDLGIRHIFMSDICTYQHCDDYFSARRLGIQSGRIFTGILLR